MLPTLALFVMMLYANTVCRNCVIAHISFATSAQVDEVRAAIDAIPDGVHGRAQLSPSRTRPNGEAEPSRGVVHIEARTYGEGYFTSTAESSEFRQVRQLYSNASMGSRQLLHCGQISL